MALVRSLAAGVLLLAAAVPAHAQNYPHRPIRFVVPFAPGGSTDTLARSIATKMGDSLGQQVVVDNRAGGNGNIGTDIVAQAPADGYTILLGYIANLAIGPHLYGSKLPYDPIKSFAPITLLAESPNILVAHPSLPVKSLKELVAYAKANPNKLNFGSASVASVGHLTGVMLNQMAGIDLQHVPYKGSGQAVVDVVGGQIQLMFSGMSSVMPHIKANRLRAIAVTGEKRSQAAPDVPTIAESGFPGFAATAWYNVAAPAKTPKVIVTRLNQEVLKTLALPDVKQRLESVGFELIGSTPEKLGDYMKTELKKWEKVVKASGAKPE